MSVLDRLIACAGNWSGTNILHDPNTGKPESTAGTATIAPVVGGRFVRFSYTWSYQGTPQEGFMLIGYDDKLAKLSGHWMDSWHQGRAVLVCPGEVQGAKLIFHGTFPAPPDPDWGWRIEVTPTDTTLRMTMHCIDPRGPDDPAVEAEYARSS